VLGFEDGFAGFGVGGAERGDDIVEDLHCFFIGSRSKSIFEREVVVVGGGVAAIFIENIANKDVFECI